MQLECRKSDLVEELLCLNNKPYCLADRKPLIALYDLEETDVLLMMGRQYGKSTFIASDSLMDIATLPFFNILYVSPRQDQTSEFSNSKLLPFIKFSPNFKDMFMQSAGLIQNVNRKTFDNGSGMILKYAFHTADAIRGISADKITIDEIQDIIMGNVPIIEECLSGSSYQWRTYAGTPKTLNNTLAQVWNKSTQNEWVLKCPHCNLWNILMMENIGPNGLICKKCGKDIPKDAQGEWVARRPMGDGVYMAGFRVPQLISPTVKWSRIIEKLKTYPTAKFMNEVMALPYDNSANPITEGEIKAVCDPDKKNEFIRNKFNDGMHIFLGVDWGHGDVSLKAQRGGAATGYTVMCAGYYDYNGNFKLLGMKRFSGMESDPIHQVQQVFQTANRIGVTAVGVDWGGGFMHNAQLKQLLGPQRIIEWQANDSLRVSARWIPEANRMLFNRTECMTDRFVEIKNQKVSFFNWQEFKDFAPDFLTICVDYRGNGRDMYYDHVLPDDAFHAYMMCKMTADHMLYSQQ